MTVKGDATLKVAAKDARGDGSPASVVFYDEFKDKENTDGTQYNNDLPPASLTLEDGATFTNAGVFAGTIVTDGGNVYGEPGAVWEMSTYEANGYALTKPYVVVLKFGLNMDCEDYTWRYGSTDMGETAGSIVWYRRPAFGVNAVIADVLNNSVKIRTELYNTTNTAGSCNLVLAAYAADGQMVAIDIKDNYLVEAQEFLWDTLEISSEKQIASVEVFLLGSNYMPLSPSVSLEAK